MVMVMVVVVMVLVMMVMVIVMMVMVAARRAQKSPARLGLLPCRARGPSLLPGVLGRLAPAAA